MDLNSSNPVEALTNLLDTTFKISIQDGRTFIGTFICIDPQGNIVLDRTSEFVKDKVGGRDVGMVLIPKKYWLTIENEGNKN